MQFIAVTLRGIEGIAAREVNGKKVLERRVLFKGKIKDFKSVNLIYRLIKLFKFKSLNDILTKVKKFPIKGSFKVRCHREGSHNFSSNDVEKGLGEIIFKQGHKVDLKNPKTTVYVDIINNNCLIGILLKENLCKRDYRIRLNPRTINPCLAYAALKLSGYEKGETLLDPLCGDGVIAIESALLKKGNVCGFDSNIKNARINSKIAKVNIEFGAYDLDWLDTVFKKNSIDRIVTFLPSTSKRRKVFDSLYKEFFHQLDHLLKKRAVVISHKKEFLQYNKNLKVKEERVVEIGETMYFIVVLEKYLKKLKK